MNNEEKMLMASLSTNIRAIDNEISLLKDNFKEVVKMLYRDREKEDAYIVKTWENNND